MTKNEKVAHDAVKVARKTGNWDGVHHLYKLVSPSLRWNATERGILHDALSQAGQL